MFLLFLCAAITICSVSASVPQVNVEFFTGEKFEEISGCKETASELASGIFAESTDALGNQQVEYYSVTKETADQVRAATELYSLAKKVALLQMNVSNDGLKKIQVLTERLISQRQKTVRFIENGKVRKMYDNLSGSSVGQLLTGGFLILMGAMVSFVTEHNTQREPDSLLATSYIVRGGVHAMNFLFLWGLGIFGVKSGLKMQRLWKRACVFKNVLGSKVYNCDDEVIQNFKDDRPVVITLQAGERLEVNQIVELRDDMIGSLSDVAV